MTQRAVCSFFPMRSLICVRLFRARLNLIFQANRLKLPSANCLKPSLNSRRFDQLVAFVINLLDEQLRKSSHPPSPWLIGILLVSLCDRCIGPEKNFFIQSPTSLCIGPEKNFFIQSPTSLANDFQAVSWARYAESPDFLSDINHSSSDSL